MSRCRAFQKTAKAFIFGEAAVESTQRICRGKEYDTTQKIRGVNWGSSEIQNALGIMNKLGRKLRDSDVAIVSDEAAGQQNRLRSQGPLDEQLF